MRLKTLEQILDVASATPPGEPVGLTHREMLILAGALTIRFPVRQSLVYGHPIVPIPWDWESQLDQCSTVP